MDANNGCHCKQILASLAKRVSCHRCGIEMTKPRAVNGVDESGRFAPTFIHPNKPAKALSPRRSQAACPDPSAILLGVLICVFRFLIN